MYIIYPNPPFAILPINRKEVGEVNLVDFAKDPDVPKVSAVSTILSILPYPKSGHYTLFFIRTTSLDY